MHSRRRGDRVRHIRITIEHRAGITCCSAELPLARRFRRRVRITGSEKVDRVTLEIGTMLPHEAVLSRTLRSMTQLSGRTVATENLQRRTVRFTYVKEQ